MTEVALQTGASLCVDVALINVSAYQECVGRALCSVRPEGGGCTRDDLNTQQRPVNCVDASQADAFCKAYQKRLPTQQEMEAIPLGSADEVVWNAGWEWTSTLGREAHRITLHYEPSGPRTLSATEVVANTQRPSLGFRCVR